MFIFLLFVWNNGNAVKLISADSSATPNPADLARHLTGIINNWLLAFSGLTLLGVLQVVAGVLSPESQTERKIEQNATQS